MTGYMDFATIEEAKAYIIEQQDKITELESRQQTLSQDNDTLRSENDSLRSLNQKYFNRLIQESEKTDSDEEDEEPIPTCEEFARTLKI